MPKVTKEELVQIINSLENPVSTTEQGKKKSKKKNEPEAVAVSPFANRTALFAAICETEWAKKKQAEGARINPPNLYNMIRAYNIPLLTPVGKKGRQKGQKIETKRKRQGRNEENYNAMIKSLNMQSERGIQPSMVKAAEKAASGSMKYAIKLKCMDCCGHDKKYVKECSSTDCALWTFRPYQAVPNGQSTEEPAEPEVVEISLPAPVAAVA